MRIEVGAHLPAQRILDLRQAIARLDHADLRVGVVGFGLVDFERRGRAQFQFLLGALQRGSASFSDSS